jgi:hypothetical protein
LVNEGVIHSTDDLIELQGDYRKFFADMISSGNFGPLSEMHRQNYLNAVNSMESGITPVIIDNTNIRASEAKNYVESALKLGYSDDNIKFVEIGTGGLLAEQLAERNTHGVPLDKIKSMIQAYESAGLMNLNKVLESKPMHSQKLFASLVLDKDSKSDLLKLTNQYIPEGWKVIAHHMTINFGNGLPDNLKDDLGEVKEITAYEIGISEMVIAIKVRDYHSDNEIPHITIAVNPKGGKPVMSNDIEVWEPLPEEIKLSGVISEEKLG